MQDEPFQARLAEASTGFEPVIRVLQTLAFPLGHDAVIERAGFASSSLTWAAGRSKNNRRTFICQVDAVDRLKTGSLPSGAGACQKTPPKKVVFFNLQSGRWDSNPRPSPWQGDVLPLNHARRGPVFLDRECREPGSNWRHRNFQSRALPTELSRPGNALVIERVRFYSLKLRLSSKSRITMIPEQGLMNLHHFYIPTILR